MFVPSGDRDAVCVDTQSPLRAVFAAIEPAYGRIPGGFSPFADLKQIPYPADSRGECAIYCSPSSSPQQPPSPPARDSRAYGSRNVARSNGTVSKARSIGGHTRSTAARCTACQRDANGRIKRDPAARRAFTGSIHAQYHGFHAVYLEA